MKSTRWIFRSLSGPALLLLGGCVAPGPYNTGSYPGYYGPPRGYMGPPPGVMSSPAPYPSPQLGPSLAPGGPSGSGGWGPTPANPPLPNGNSNFSPGPANKPPDKLAPLYPEDTGPGPGPGLSPTPSTPAPQPGEQNSTPFGAEGGTTFDKNNGGAQMPVRKPADAGVQAYASVATEPFEPPVEKGARPHSDPNVVPAAGRSPAASGAADSANPYDYDRRSYSWLRGVVDYDARDKTWQIIYNPNPDAHDKYGGAFCLADHPKLKELHEGDYVYIEGRINAQHPDARGKACYEVEGGQLARIRYSGRQSVAN